MFIGLAEVGGLKYKGVPCHSPDDAMQSAAAVANANLVCLVIQILITSCCRVANLETSRYTYHF